MSSVRNYFSGLMILVLLVSLAGCSSLTVNYDYDQNVEWTKFKTFGWVENPNQPVNPTGAIPESPMLDQRIRNSVEWVLEEKGLTASDSPDLLAIFHLGSKEKIQVTDWGYRYSDYYWGYGGRQIDVYQFTEGSLVIDLIDAETKDLVWRGTGTKVIDTSQKTPEEVQTKLDNIVAKIMDSFPPE